MPIQPQITSRAFIEHDEEPLDTNQNIQTERFVPPPNEFYRGPSERRMSVDKSPPEMYKFTMDDAIKRENFDFQNLTAIYGPGPVTLAPAVDNDGPLFDASLIETNPVQEANEILEDIRKMTHKFPSGVILNKRGMTGDDFNMPSGPSFASPSTIATKLALPNYKRQTHQYEPQKSYRGRTKFGWKQRSIEDPQPAGDIKYSASNVNISKMPDNSNINSNSWEPIGTIPLPKDDPEIEITKEKIIEFHPEMFQTTVAPTPVEVHTTERTRNKPRHTNVHNSINNFGYSNNNQNTNLEVSKTYSQQRNQGTSAEIHDNGIIYRKPQSVAVYVTRPPPIEVNRPVIDANKGSIEVRASIDVNRPSNNAYRQMIDFNRPPHPIELNRPLFDFNRPPVNINHSPIDRIPKASITEYKAPSMYVPLRRYKPIERHSDDAVVSQAMRHERPVIAPRSEVTKYFQ